MSWIQIIAFIVMGFIALGKGAEWLVGGGTVVARRLGISVLAIGLTVVAWGTSLPEVVVSTHAALQGSAAISLGNVLGSNISNIALVLGACALVLPAVLEGRLGGRESFWMLGSLGLLWFLASDGSLSRVEGGVMLVAFAIHTWDVFREAKDGDSDSATDEMAEVLEHLGDKATHWYKHPYVEVFIGMLAIALGAYLVVEGAKGGAIRLEVPERVIGLTIVALGTSLPELAAGLGGALKGEKDISLGNVVGSNVFNVLAVMGITALIYPLDPALEAAKGNETGSTEVAAAFEGALTSDFPLTMAISIFLVCLPFLGGARFGRAKGLLLVAIYVSYSAWLYLG